MNFIYRFSKVAVLSWSIVIMTVFSVAVIIYRTIMPMDGSEMAHMQVNNFLFIVEALLLIILLIFFVRWVSQYDGRLIFLVGAVIYFVCGSYLIFHQNDVIRHDALAVLDAARAINDGNFNSLTDISGYLYKYPHQLGLVSFERLILLIFGSKNVKVFFGLNLIFAVGDNFLIWRITAELTRNQRLANVVLLLSFFFVPQLFMILFVYGINFGLFFVLLASLFLLRFLKTNQWGNMILSVIFFTIANTIRNNYIIFLLAVAIVVMIEFFKDKKFKKLLYIVLLFVSIKLTNTSITAYYQNVSGNARLTGEPKIAWIAMGLNDTPMYNRVGGWYDAFVENVYNENKGNSSKIEKASKLQLTKRISYMSSHLGYTANFFKNKFISTWTDSLFQSVWSGPISKLSVEGQRINGTIMKSIYNSGKLFKIIYRYSAVILIAIYLFATVGLVKLFVTSSLSSLALLPTIYLSGGLIFHLIWETKSQYVYPYVYVLIPLAGYGLFQIMNAQLMKTKR